MTFEKSAKFPGRIFVSEYVCGGGCLEASLEPSLAREGRAMLLNVVSDFLRIPGCEITTTWDRRLGEFPLSASPGLKIHEVDSANEAAQFKVLCRDSDAALVIAPEFHGILARRTAVAAEHTLLLGSDVAAIELCGDKLALATFLIERDIPTIPTAALDLAAPEACWPFPIVMKPRDGAGSLETFLIDDSRQLLDRSREVSDASETGIPFDFVQQPFVVGERLSAAVICSLDGTRESLPVCRQVLSDDGRFQYLRSDWNPGLSHWQVGVDHLTERTLGEIPGLSGYVGFDLIGSPDGSVQIVEINPRLTTGYLVWQKRTDSNLAGRILGSDEQITDSDTTNLIWRSQSGN